MLRKRSRGTASTGGGGKQALTMADSACSSLPSQSGNYKKPTSSSFFSSPRLFTNFTSKGFLETETIMSPTSILDTNRPFSAFRNSFWSETNSPRTPSSEPNPKRYWDKLDSSKGVGLVLVDSLIDERQNQNSQSKPETRMVLFGSHLKIQIPPISPAKTGNSDSSSGSLPSSPAKKSGFGSSNSNSPRVFAGCLSASEIELSEDYTRVISHGPNPRTTHIFDNCIIERSCLDDGTGFSAQFVASSENFLSFCFYCKKNLGQGEDIYMYR